MSGVMACALPRQHGRALLWAAAELQGDREIVLKAVAQNGYALQYAAAELQGDREIVLAAVAQNALALRDAAAELKGDREIVRAAVAQNGDALEYAAAELQGDPPLLKLRSINPQLSAVVLVVELRLHLGYACHERVGCQSILKSLPLEVIELIGQHLTIGVAVHGLIWRSTSLLSEGVPPSTQFK